MLAHREIKISFASTWRHRPQPSSQMEATMPPVPTHPMVNGLPLTLCEITIRLIYLSCAQTDRACSRLPIAPNRTGSLIGSRSYYLRCEVPEWAAESAIRQVQS